MADEPTYLYSYGTRRHIADPETQPSRYGRQPSLCGQKHDTDETMADLIRRYAHTAERAEAAITKRRAEPVCKRCAKKWEARS